MRPFIDRQLQGGTFGKWTVVDRAKRPFYWVCKCECGDIRCIYEYSLINGRSRACRNCMRVGQRLKHLVGMKFGALTVVERVGSNKNNQALWKCRCECGSSVNITTTKLTHRKQKSCGCLQFTGAILPHGQSSFNRVFDRYRRGAKDRGLDFNLSKEEFLKITQLDCHYCGMPPIKEYRIGNSVYTNGRFRGNGVDRMNNESGYTIENSTPCCETCNRAKNAMSYEDFRKWIDRLVNHNSATLKKTASTTKSMQNN